MSEQDGEHQKRLKILVVDDEANIREMLTAFLENEGFRVLKADSGLAAIQCIEEEHPHIVLLDIRMPDMDGLQCLRKITDGGHNNVEVVMMSGFATIEMAKKSLDLGAFDYIRKPLAFDHLRDVIHHIDNSRFLEFF